jgi:ferrous iron transport protein A
MYSWRRIAPGNDCPSIHHGEAVSMTSLAQLSLGQTAKVVQIASANLVCQRLMEMGVTPGVQVRYVGSAPLGDPLEYELRGYRLCMRRSEAEQIQVEAL